MSRNKKYPLQGIFSEDAFKYLEYILSIKTIYQHKTDVLKKVLDLNEIKAQVFYTDTSILVNNYNKPIDHFLNSKFVTVDYRTNKKLNFLKQDRNMIKEYTNYRFTKFVCSG